MMLSVVKNYLGKWHKCHLVTPWMMIWGEIKLTGVTWMCKQIYTVCVLFQVK